MDQHLKFVWNAKPAGLKLRILDFYHRRRFKRRLNDEESVKPSLDNMVITSYPVGRVRPLNLDDQPFRKFYFELQDQDGKRLIRLLAREIDFDGSLQTAPQGWEELHRLGNQQWQEKGGLDWKPDTIAFYWISVTSDPALHRRGLAGNLVEQIAEWATAKGYSYLFAPALPSSRRTSKELVSMGFDDFSARHREDGLPSDPWIRSLTKSGFEVMGWCPTSHRFVTDGWGFHSLTSQEFPKGELVAPIKMDKRTGWLTDSWEQVSHFPDHDLYTWDWGCALMKRSLR